MAHSLYSALDAVTVNSIAVATDIVDVVMIAIAIATSCDRARCGAGAHRSICEWSKIEAEDHGQRVIQFDSALASSQHRTSQQTRVVECGEC